MTCIVVFVAALGDRGGAPAGILAPGHVATAEFRGGAVALLHDLLGFGNSRIPFPTGARAFLRQVAVDIAAAEETHTPAAAHHHGEVLIAQLRLRLAVELEIENVIGVARNRGQVDYESGPEELGIVSAAVAIVGGNRFRFVDQICLAAVRRGGGDPGLHGCARAGGIEAERNF